MNADTTGAKVQASFNWEDLFDLDSQLSEDERRTS